MEKRGTTGEVNVKNLIKQADNEEIVLVVNFDGFRKYADSNHDKPGLVIVATGERATKLRTVLAELLT